MLGKGLSKEIILKESVILIESDGFENFSLRTLAKHLGIKASSLYNHIENISELMALISNYAIEEMNKQELYAIKHSNNNPIYSLSIAYRDFSKKHPELYRIIMNLFNSNIPSNEIIGKKITLPFMKVLANYPLDDFEKAHWQRILRSILHGFVSQESAGFFNHYPIDEEETFAYGIQSFIDGLNKFIRNKERRN